MKVIGINSQLLEILPKELLQQDDSFALVDIKEVKAKKISSTQVDPSKTIIIGTAITDIEIMNLALQGGYRHIVQGRGQLLTSEVERTLRIMTHPSDCIQNPIRTVLPGYIRHKFSEKISGSKERAKVLESLKAFIKTVPKSTPVQERILTQANELTMNAVFSGPGQEEDNKPFQLSERTDTIILPDLSQAHLFVAATEHQIVVGCEDPYGSLQIPTVLKKIQKCCEQGVAQSINHGPGGAGIGSYMIFRSSQVYSIFVDPGKTTVVSAIMPLGLRASELEKVPRSLHLVEL